MTNNLKFLFRSMLGLGLLCFVHASFAENWADRTSYSGFFSTRYSQTDEASAFNGAVTENGINEDGSFQGTKLGINLTTFVSDDLTIAMQFFSAIEGSDSYGMDLDWAFASFRLNDHFTLRSGKIKYPVGLVNEYVDVGVAYPWIQAPLVIYSESGSGPQATREAYTGASLLWESLSNTWSYDTDLFMGQVDLSGMTIKNLIGLKAHANWDDVVEFQLASYVGEMKPDDPTSPMGMMMNEKDHEATVVGIKVDWNNIVFYSEAADVKMDVKMMGTAIMDSDSWYATLGYNFGPWMPHYTYQDWEQGNGYGHSISTIGLNYALSSDAVLKLEVSDIETDKFNAPNMMNMGTVGLFDGALANDSTSMYSLAVDVIF